MKGFSEQRGVQTQVVFDADKGQFVLQDVVHDFLSAPQPLVSQPPDAIIIDLASRAPMGKAAPKVQKRRVAAPPSLKITRTG